MTAVQGASFKFERGEPHQAGKWSQQAKAATPHKGLSEKQDKNEPSAVLLSQQHFAGRLQSRNFFLQLLTVSNVRPKGALSSVLFRSLQRSAVKSSVRAATAQSGGLAEELR